MPQKRSLDIRLRIDFASGKSLGPGKMALLEAIEATGSLSQAAMQLEMSYRRAWQLLTDLNESFATSVVIATTGGAGGGGAQLTDFGRELLSVYRETEQEVRALVQSRLSGIASKASPPPSKSVAGAKRARSPKARVRSVKPRR